jgi:multidrug resistance efflux pump
MILGLARATRSAQKRGPPSTRAKAVMENANSKLPRRLELFSAGVVSREELDRYAPRGRHSAACAC